MEKDNVNYLAGVREIGVRSEYTDGRDMPRLLIRSVEFEGPFYEAWPPASHRNIFVDFDRKSDLPAYARKIIRELRDPRLPPSGHRRRRSRADGGVSRRSSAAGAAFEDSVKDALLVVLTSPQFLFLVENSNTPAPEPLDNYELASKLSYFLWNGPPDHKTLQLAASGTLRKQLDAEVARMIADPRFARFTREFASQWLSLDKFQVLEPDRKRYPKLTRDARTQLKQEPVEFLQYLMRNNLPVRNLIQSDFVVANEAVASYYDLADKTESGFEFVAIPHGRPELGGVLTQAAILAGLSDGRESNPVKRGRLAGAQDHRRTAGRSAAQRAGAQGGHARAHAPPAARTASQSDRHACSVTRRSTRGEWRFEEFDAGGRLKQQPVDAKSTLPDKTEVNGRERFEAVPRRRSHRSGGVQFSEAPGDLCDRPHPDVQRAGVPEAGRLEIEGRRLPDAGHDPVCGEQQNVPGKIVEFRRIAHESLSSDSTAVLSSRAWEEWRWPCPFSTPWARK